MFYWCTLYCNANDFYYNHYTDIYYIQHHLWCWSASFVMLVRTILFLVNQLKSTVEVRSWRCRHSLQPQSQCIAEWCSAYNRVLLKGVVYVSSSYKPSTSNNNCIIILTDDSVGITRYSSQLLLNCGLLLLVMFFLSTDGFFFIQLSLLALLFLNFFSTS